jgi:hypothetical protein
MKSVGSQCLVLLPWAHGMCDTTWWEHVVEQTVHFMIQKAKREGRGWSPTVPFEAHPQRPPNVYHLPVVLLGTKASTHAPLRDTYAHCTTSVVVIFLFVMSCGSFCIF